jgi:hypothetical protein
MEFPRQPGLVRIKIEADHPEDIFKAKFLIENAVRNHYADTNGYQDPRFVDTFILDCFPFAIND